MKKYLFELLVVFFSLFLCSCSSYSKREDSEVSYTLGEVLTDEEVNLTCVAHDDNESYGAWHQMVYDYDGIFNYFDNMHPLYTNKRLTIYTPIGYDIEVMLLNDSNEVVYSAIPDAFGKCYLFPNWSSYQYKVLVKYYPVDSLEPVEQTFTVTNELRVNVESKIVEKDLIDLMFVVDTTASMGDELDYLRNEITDVIERLSSFNSCNVNVSILLYKDKGETYETLYSDFTTNVAEQVEFLENKIAYGGGDFEECVETAMEEAVNKNWSGRNSTKVLVHIADAPSHDGDINSWYNSVLKLSSKGIKLITVASSGVNKKTEYLFRSMTVLTGGTYVAVTNHSGYGDEHIDSSNSEELVVEYLDNCLVRIISSYYTGVSYNPVGIN